MNFRWSLLAICSALLFGTTAQGADFNLAGTVTYRCTNPASNANWNIAIDFERHVADAYPAGINDTEIAWHNTDDAGNYSLDRRTGRLTIVRASSTGGYMVFAACVLGD
jgi:hypothetical protein